MVTEASLADQVLSCAGDLLHGSDNNLVAVQLPLVGMRSPVSH